MSLSEFEGPSEAEVDAADLTRLRTKLREGHVNLKCFNDLEAGRLFMALTLEERERVAFSWRFSTGTALPAGLVKRRFEQEKVK